MWNFFKGESSREGTSGTKTEKKEKKEVKTSNSEGYSSRHEGSRTSSPETSEKEEKLKQWNETTATNKKLKEYINTHLADLVSQGINDYMTIRTSQKMQILEENQRSYNDYCQSLSQDQSLSEQQRGEQRVNFRLEQMKNENGTLTMVKIGLADYIRRRQIER